MLLDNRIIYTRDYGIFVKLVVKPEKIHNV
jgi:hypothetical protein